MAKCAAIWNKAHRSSGASDTIAPNEMSCAFSDEVEFRVPCNREVNGSNRKSAQ